MVVSTQAHGESKLYLNYGRLTKKTLGHHWDFELFSEDLTQCGSVTRHPQEKETNMRVGWDASECCCCCLFFETGFLCVALEPVLELTLKTRLTSNSQRSACLCLSNAGIKGLHHHHPAASKFYNQTTDWEKPAFVQS